MIATTDEIYAFVELTMKRCGERGLGDISQQLDDAMHLGSSGMEILGAIRAVLIAQAARLTGIVEQATIQEVIDFVNKSFGE